MARFFNTSEAWFERTTDDCCPMPQPPLIGRAGEQSIEQSRWNTRPIHWPRCPLCWTSVKDPQRGKDPPPALLAVGKDTNVNEFCACQSEKKTFLPNLVSQKSRTGYFQRSLLGLGNESIFFLWQVPVKKHNEILMTKKTNDVAVINRRAMPIVKRPASRQEASPETRAAAFCLSTSNRNLQDGPANEKDLSTPKTKGSAAH